jgi:hypothetical protein
MKPLRKLIGWPLSNALYYIGHWSYLILDALPDSENEEPGRLFRALWRSYQWCMGASVDVNDWADLSVWSRPKDHTVLR